MANESQTALLPAATRERLSAALIASKKIVEEKESEHRRWSNRRLFAFLAIAVSQLYYWQGSSFRGLSLVLTGLFALVFFYCVKVHAKVVATLRQAELQLKHDEDRKQRCFGESEAESDLGLGFAPEQHPYSGDLSLFGKRSVYRLICSAYTPLGKQRFAEDLLELTADPNEVLKRQLLIQQLAADEHRAARQATQIAALAFSGPRLNHDGKKSNQQIPDLATWGKTAESVKLGLALRLVALLVPFYFLCAIFYPFPGLLSAAVLLLGAVLSAKVERASQLAYAVLTQSSTRLDRLEPLLAAAERLSHAVLSSDGAAQKIKEGNSPQDSVIADWDLIHSGEARRALQGLGRLLSFYQIRENGIAHFFAAIFLVCDVHLFSSLQSWKEKYGAQIEKWLAVIAELEVKLSWADWSSDNPEHQYAEITEEVSFDAASLSHPLLDIETRVGNDLHLQKPGSLLLITGSNMSGKSTLMRTMALAIVLARQGAAVPCSSLKLTLSPLLTSLSISDSLARGYSHFYAELDKVREAMRMSEEQRGTVVLFDEILHGTNSVERLEGASWIFAELSKLGAVAVISTHDLALCEAANRGVSQLRIVHLKEMDAGAELHFDYILREGPVPSGNAIRLMRSLGLNIPLSPALSAS